MRMSHRIASGCAVAALILTQLIFAEVTSGS